MPVFRHLDHEDYRQVLSGRRRWFIKQRRVEDFGVDELRDLDGLIDAHTGTASLHRIGIGPLKTFLKIKPLTNLSKRIRATFGIRRKGAFDWAIAEIHSALHAQHWNLVPELYAYGWDQGRSGLIRRAYIVMEDLEAAVNVLEFVQRFPEQREAALELTFDTLLSTLQRGLLHLDPWPGNFMVDLALTKCWLIDLECSKVDSAAPLDRQLGFSLGFFYRGKFSNCMDRAEYMHFLQAWLENRVPALDHDEILALASTYSEGRFSRKHRLDLM